jgi:hypothetical protein
VRDVVVVVVVVINTTRVCARVWGKSSSPLNRIKPELDIIWRDEWDYACIANGQAPQHRGSGIQWYSFYDRLVVASISKVLCVCACSAEPFSFLFFIFTTTNYNTHLHTYIYYNITTDVFPFTWNFYFYPPPR